MSSLISENRVLVSRLETDRKLEQAGQSSSVEQEVLALEQVR